MSEKYNGWTNYETWNVKLWLDNDRETYDAWRIRSSAALLSAVASGTFTKQEQAVLNLSRSLKQSIGDDAPDLGHSMYADLLGAALSEVNWHEIAQSYIDDLIAESREIR